MANIKRYLEYHKIGALFEEMMQKLTKEMPNDPYAFLTEILSEKSTRRVQFEPTSPGLQKSLDTGKRRDYDKPWTAKKFSKQNWNADTKVTAKSFDDLFHHQKIGPFAEEMVVTIPDQQANTRMKRKLRYNEDDLMADELPQAAVEEKPVAEDVDFMDKNGRRVNENIAKNQHQKELQMLVETNGISGDDNLDTQKSSREMDGADDGAAELIEDLDDLRSEGVDITDRALQKVPHKQRVVPRTSEDVSVTVCARCAKIIPGFDGAARSEVDEEVFESASQVTGPRHPTWSADETDDDEHTLIGQSYYQSPAKNKASPRSGVGEFSDFLNDGKSLKREAKGTSSASVISAKSDRKAASVSKKDDDLSWMGGKYQSWKLPPTDDSDSGSNW